MINIIKVYEKFSKVSGLLNNAAKTVYGLTREKEDKRAKKIMDSLVENFGAEVDNFRFNGQGMKLLGDTIGIGKD